MMKRAGFYILISVLLAAARIASAELSPPAGPIVLMISGNIDEETDGAGTRFDLDMLEALPQREIRTKTPWHNGMTTFSGPRLSTLVDAVEGSGKTLRVVALNEYSAEIPVEEIRNYPVILATRINGSRIPVREKGPLLVIYPFSEAPELYHELTFNRSVWQVMSLVIE